MMEKDKIYSESELEQLIKNISKRNVASLLLKLYRCGEDEPQDMEA